MRQEDQGPDPQGVRVLFWELREESRQPVTGVWGFENTAQMRDWLEAREKTGHPAQQGLTCGDDWLTYNAGLTIFGRIPTEGQYFSGERLLGASAEEAIASTRKFVKMVENGRLWSMCSSTVVPDGEWGAWDYTQVWPIEKKWYDEAKAKAWDTTKVSTACLINITECCIALRGGGS